MAGWGIVPWGLGLWGALPPDLSIVSAVARSTRTVRVTLTTPPRAAAPTGAGDALNPATWTVTRLDTLAAFTVVGVLPVLGSDVDFDVQVLESFASILVLHEVASTTLVRAVDGALILAPTSATFQGVIDAAVETSTAVAASRRYITTDLDNPPTPRNPVGGVLVMTSGGDYSSMTGAPLVKKLIIRRVATRVGEFFHLPQYGIGINVKEPLPASDLVRLKTEIERQALLEPEVAEVSAGLVLSPNNILTINIRARLEPTGDVFEDSFTFPSPVVAL